jgi:hypothetical protein
MSAMKQKPNDQPKRSVLKKKADAPKIYAKSKVRSLSSKNNSRMAKKQCDCDPVKCACWDGKCGCDPVKCACWDGKCGCDSF